MSLFRRATKYTARPDLSQAENRLTEITAAVLEFVPAFAAAFGTELLVAARSAEYRAPRKLVGPGAEHPSGISDGRGPAMGEIAPREPEIRTQFQTASGRFVDLEIRMPGEAQDGARHSVVWVEVKHGAPVHGDQLEVYRRDIERLEADGVVVVLAPLQHMPRPEDVQNTPVVTWQRMGQLLARWLKDPAIGGTDRFLLTQYALYLKEEDLMDDALTINQALAIEHYDAASRTLERLCDYGSALVTEGLGREIVGQHESWGRVAYGRDWWSAYALQGPPTWRGAWLEWGLISDAGRSLPRNIPAFAAGASVGKDDNPVTVPENAGWLADLGRHGFESYRGNQQRIYRFLYPEQLLIADTLEGQARTLADWVVESFRVVESTAPPN